MALGRPDGLSVALLFGGFAREVLAGGRVMGRLDGGDRVERPVELAVAPPIEAHSLDLTGARGDRGDAGEDGERIG